MVESPEHEAKRLTTSDHGGNMYEKFTWYLMAFSGIAMWALVGYAVYETLANPSPFG